MGFSVWRFCFVWFGLWFVCVAVVCWFLLFFIVVGFIWVLGFVWVGWLVVFFTTHNEVEGRLCSLGHIFYSESVNHNFGCGGWSRIVTEFGLSPEGENLPEMIYSCSPLRAGLENRPTPAKQREVGTASAFCYRARVKIMLIFVQYSC